MEEDWKIQSRMVVVAVLAVLAGMRPVDILHMIFAQQELVGRGRIHARRCKRCYGDKKRCVNKSLYRADHMESKKWIISI